MGLILSGHNISFLSCNGRMYRSFFGLKELPFKISPDLSYFYKQASREEITDALLYSILRGDGIVKVVGDVGIGKTMILRMLAEKLPAHYQKIYISSPNLSPIDFLKFICSELQISYDSTDTKHDLVKRLQTHLIEVYSKGQRVVMLVDEAQAMTLDVLEEVRLLGNLETETDKLLQIVLFGQPELDATLNDVRIKPLKDRIASELMLPALNPAEVLMYLNYRMRVAGRLEQDVFDSSVAKRVWQITGGFPRAINLLADKLLMSAFSHGENKVKKKHFKMIGYGSSESAVNNVLAIFKFMVVVVTLMVVLGGVGSILYKDLYSKDNLNSVSKTIAPPPASKSMTKLELSEKTHADLKVIKQLYRLNMTAVSFVQGQQSSQRLLLFSRTSLNQFPFLYTKVMSLLGAEQKNKVYVLLNLKPQINRFEVLTFYDASSLSDSALVELKTLVSQNLPQLQPRLLSIRQLINYIKEMNYEN
ncbi:ExeA family protein [Hydrogenovibrio kuenenii]|uniref:ExeA family protein n=1 Tax=Hydrogenovibrio kuenenii TaxID=63658 RepID=UPI0004BBF585|nr:AAA family ATPase [Hydrogenovibrio kuenenii]